MAFHAAGGSTPSTELPRSRLPLGNYGWLYRNLPPCPRLAAEELDDIAAAMTDREPPSHPELPAAFTYLGQFIAHDLTFNPASAHQLQDDPELLYNHRTPAFDLDSLYGRGPQLQPYLYSVDQPFRFEMGMSKSDNGGDGGKADLPRGPQGLALAADPRNDENLVLSQLTTSFLKFHNQVITRVEVEEKLRGPAAFRRAHEQVQWHYQWLVLHDYLPRILHPTVLARLAPIWLSVGSHFDVQLRHFAPTVAPYLPIEFAAAAFRFGHTQIRESYRLNETLASEVPLFEENRDDLSGGRRLRAGWHVEWDFFLPTSDLAPQRSAALDSHLARPLASVPLPGERTVHLARADLEMGQTLRLPSGQALARAMGVSELLTGADVGLPGASGHATPLWYYLLKEAEVQTGGKTLGLLGSELVGEVVVGLVRMDDFSFLSVDPAWEPNHARNGRFGLTELVTIAWGG